MATKSESKKRKSITHQYPVSVKKLKESRVEVDTEPINDSKNSNMAIATKHVQAKATSKCTSSGKRSAQPDLSDSDEQSASDTDNKYAAALMRGFETSSDSESDDEVQVVKAIPAIPDSTGKALSKSRDKSRDAPEKDGPVVLYVGHIPHGFYEHQMRAYFSQFGDITRLRLSRNRRTGASRHYAFVEFASAEVARIVADTMDGYLMFGHILKIKVVPPEEVHENLFKGAGKRFKRIPWRGIERKRLNQTDRKTWSRRIRKEEDRRQSKKEKLTQMGYSFSPPTLSNVTNVPMKTDDITSKGK